MPCYHPIEIEHPTRKKYRLEGRRLNKYEQLLIPRALLVPCGKCPQCVRRRQRDWKVRIMAEHKVFNYRGCFFVTLTFDDDHLLKYWKGDGSPCITQNFKDYDLPRIVRLFLERVRKKTGKSVRHVFIPEFGNPLKHTGRLHLHGLLFGCTLSREDLLSCWSNGFIHVHYYCDARTSGYITKYLTKDMSNPTPVFVSAGIGSSLVCPGTRKMAERILRGIDTDTRICFNGYKYGMPLYIYNKLFDYLDRFIISYRRDPLDFAGLHFETIDKLLSYKDFLASINPGPPPRNYSSGGCLLTFKSTEFYV